MHVLRWAIPCFALLVLACSREDSHFEQPDAAQMGPVPEGGLQWGDPKDTNKPGVPTANDAGARAAGGAGGSGDAGTMSGGRAGSGATPGGFGER